MLACIICFSLSKSIAIIEITMIFDSSIYFILLIMCQVKLKCIMHYKALIIHSVEYVYFRQKIVSRFD